MKARVDFRRMSPEGMKAMGQLHAFIHDCGLDQTLLELVKLRASQINGCAHCIDMHVKELRAIGEDEQRLYLLNAWKESPFYSDRERAALAWCEAVTCVTEGHVPDEVYEMVQAQFSERELVNLTLAIVAINGANRLNIAFRTVPGSHRVRRAATAAE
ncbi:MAG TPA: carboxymuconolactone decarboxylase family protein [Tepidisphaeraceae bacterium]